MYLMYPTNPNHPTSRDLFAGARNGAEFSIDDYFIDKIYYLPYTNELVNLLACASN